MRGGKERGGKFHIFNQRELNCILLKSFKGLQGFGFLSGSAETQEM